jgi:hypothetical protein
MQQLLPSTKRELPAWIYVRGKMQFKSMCCLEGIECSYRRNLTLSLPIDTQVKGNSPRTLTGLYMCAFF